MAAVFLGNVSQMGNWEMGKQKNLVATLKLQESQEVTVYPINSGTNQPNKSKSIQIKNPDTLLKTKECAFYLCTFVTVRTHSVKDAILDTVIPFTRRIVANSDDSGIEAIKVIAALVADLFTLLFRLITLVPRLVYNSGRAHPCKEEAQDSEALFVSCQKTWIVEATKVAGNEDEKETCQIVARFQWRVDLYSPLSNFYNFDQWDYVIDGHPYVRTIWLENGDLTSIQLFGQDFSMIKPSESNQNSEETLTKELAKVVKAPEISFC